MSHCPLNSAIEIKIVFIDLPSSLIVYIYNTYGQKIPVHRQLNVDGHILSFFANPRESYYLGISPGRVTKLEEEYKIKIYIRFK